MTLFNFNSQTKQDKILIYVLLLAVVVGFVVLWQIYFKDLLFSYLFPEKPVVFTEKRVNIENFKKDFEILENEIFKKLEDFEKIKPYEGEIFKENPFIPFKSTK